VRKSYHAATTPYQRLPADARTPPTVRRELEAEYAKLDPVRLLSDIRLAQARLVEIDDQPIAGAAPPAGAIPPRPQPTPLMRRREQRLEADLAVPGNIGE
jgi:hypothetical protein